MSSKNYDLNAYSITIYLHEYYLGEKLGHFWLCFWGQIYCPMQNFDPDVLNVFWLPACYALCGRTSSGDAAYLSSYPRNLREPHGISMRLLEISRATWHVSRCTIRTVLGMLLAAELRVYRMFREACIAARKTSPDDRGKSSLYSRGTLSWGMRAATTWNPGEWGVCMECNPLLW